MMDMSILSTLRARVALSPQRRKHGRTPARPGTGAVDGRPVAGGTRAPCRVLEVPPVMYTDDVPHGGSPDLVLWPMSLVEAVLVDEILAGADRYIELIEVCQSAPRALAVIGRRRSEHATARTLARAFGHLPTRTPMEVRAWAR